MASDKWPRPSADSGQPSAANRYRGQAENGATPGQPYPDGEEPGYADGQTYDTGGWSRRDDSYGPRRRADPRLPLSQQQAAPPPGWPGDGWPAAEEPDGQPSYGQAYPEPSRFRQPGSRQGPPNQAPSATDGDSRYSEPAPATGRGPDPSYAGRTRPVPTQAPGQRRYPGRPGYAAPQAAGPQAGGPQPGGPQAGGPQAGGP